MNEIISYALLYTLAFLVVGAILMYMFRSPNYQEENEEMREYNDRLLKTMFDFFRAVGEDMKAADIEKELKRRGYTRKQIHRTQIEDWR